MKSRLSMIAGGRIRIPGQRRLKRPDGTVIEEFVTASQHVFHGGKLVGHINEPEGDYTGRVCFRYPDGRMTRWYTAKTMPKWLRALWDEVALG